MAVYKTISSKAIIRKIFRDLKPDKDNWGYVCEWDTITSTDLDKLFHIHKECVLNKASIWA